MTVNNAKAYFKSIPALLFPAALLGETLSGSLVAGAVVILGGAAFGVPLRERKKAVQTTAPMKEIL